MMISPKILPTILFATLLAIVAIFVFYIYDVGVTYPEPSGTIAMNNEQPKESQNISASPSSSPTLTPTASKPAATQSPSPSKSSNPTPTPTKKVTPSPTTVVNLDYYYLLKDVGEPYLDRFGLAPRDYRSIKEAGFNVIESNFDICAVPSDVVVFLEGAYDAGLRVVMTAGAGEAEWGYPCDEQYSYDQKPKWEKEKVQEWVRKWAYHPAIIAWDISNEDGQNFPNAEGVDNDWALHGFALTTAQLQEAYHDVKEADPTRPIMIRMNGWYFYDYDSDFFRAGNAFGPQVADIVMVNAYSNVDEYFPTLVTTVTTRTRDAVKAINPQAKIIVAIGAWEEPPIWFKPSIQNLENDFIQVNQRGDISGFAVFKYGAEGSDGSDKWWMPREGADVWSALGNLIKNAKK